MNTCIDILIDPLGMMNINKKHNIVLLEEHLYILSKWWKGRFVFDDSLTFWRVQNKL